MSDASLYLCMIGVTGLLGSCVAAVLLQMPSIPFLYAGACIIVAAFKLIEMLFVEDDEMVYGKTVTKHKDLPLAPLRKK